MSLHMIGPGRNSPEVVNAVVEIPYGSRIKYEIDHVTLRELEHFFLTYKNLEAKDVRSEGWEGKEAAHAFIEACTQAYRH